MGLVVGGLLIARWRRCGGGGGGVVGDVDVRQERVIVGASGWAFRGDEWCIKRPGVLKDRRRSVELVVMIVSGPGLPIAADMDWASRRWTSSSSPVECSVDSPTGGIAFFIVLLDCRIG